MKKLSNDEIEEQLQTLAGWALAGNAIEKAFSFKDFSETFGFMTKVALLAEKLNHHPDWCGGYNKLTIRLSTHNANGLTANDFTLAAKIDGLLP